MTSPTNDTRDRETVRAYRDVRKDYAFDPSIFNGEPDRIRAAKAAVDRLPEVDRILFLLYADCGSLRKLAARLGLSHTTLNKEIRRIRQEIIASL